MTDSPLNIDHPLVHAPGVYFGLSEEEYHRALALSASGIKWLRVSTLDWWVRSPLNPTPEDDEDSEAKAVGRAYHKRILEGRDAFYARYAPALDQHDFPHALRTNEEIVAAIEAAGGPVRGLKGKRKADLIATLEEYDQESAELCWDRLAQAHAAHHAGKEFLSAKTVRKIEVAAQMIEAHPQLGKAFRGGRSEVSIFWIDLETGTPMKARLDHWKTQAIVDLKSFDPRGVPIDKAIARAVATYKYHIQTRVYLDAVRVASQLIREGLVYGDGSVDYRNFVRNVVPEPTFLFVFSAKGPAPLARGKVLGPGSVLDIARIEVDEAMLLWARCWQTFGASPWVDISDIATFEDTAFPVYLTE